MRSNRFLVAGAAAGLTLASGGCSLFGGRSMADGSVIGVEEMDTLAADTPATAPLAPSLSNARLESTEGASLDQTYAAALGAISAMEYRVRKHASNAMEARVLGETPDGDAVIVRMSADDDGQTRIAIRVGTAGDEPASQRLLEEIRSRLRAQDLAAGGQSPDEGGERSGDGEVSASEFATVEDPG